MLKCVSYIQYATVSIITIIQQILWLEPFLESLYDRDLSAKRAVPHAAAKSPWRKNNRRNITEEKLFKYEI